MPPTPSPPAPTEPPSLIPPAPPSRDIRFVWAGVAALAVLTLAFISFYHRPSPRPLDITWGVATSTAFQSTSTTSGATPDSAEWSRGHLLLLWATGPSPAHPDEQAVVYTVRQDGSEKAVLATEAGSPSWTPDGRIIYIGVSGSVHQIWLMNADGSDKHQLGNLKPSLQPLMPQMGKNGLIVFMGNDKETVPDGNAGIYVMKINGSGLKELTRGMQPFLAPSGAWLTYTFQTNEPYHREIWRINADGSGKRELTFLGDADYPDANASAISPDEQWVAFFSGKESDRMLPGKPMQSIFTFGHRNVAVIPVEGGPRKTLTPCKPVTTQAELDTATVASGTCIAADNPAWSPDGKWLIFDQGFADGGPTGLINVDGTGYERQFYPDSRGIVRVPLKELP